MIRCVFLVFLILQAHAFAPEDLLLKIDEDLTPPLTLTDEQVKQDVELLIYALEHGYSGRVFADQKKFELAMNALRDIDLTHSPVYLKEQIDDALMLIPDNHLEARLYRHSSEKRAQYRKRPMIGPNSARLAGEIWQVEKKSLDEPVLWIAISSFPSRHDEVWNGFIDKVKEMAPTVNTVVIDLRGNPGGDDGMGMALASYLYGGQAPSPIRKQYVMQTPEALILWSNYWRFQQIKELEFADVAPAYMQNYVDGIMSQYKQLDGAEKPMYVIDNLGKGDDYNAEKAFTGNIFVIADSGCGSSCEITLSALLAHPNAKFVGQTTAGTIHFGNIGYFALPNSKILVRIPTVYNAFSGSSSIERRGFAPDIMVPDYSDPAYHLHHD